MSSGKLCILLVYRFQNFFSLTDRLAKLFEHLLYRDSLQESFIQLSSAGMPCIKGMGLAEEYNEGLHQPHSKLLGFCSSSLATLALGNEISKLGGNRIRLYGS